MILKIFKGLSTNLTPVIPVKAGIYFSERWIPAKNPSIMFRAGVRE
jgi:hypothetical protein